MNKTKRDFYMYSMVYQYINFFLCAAEKGAEPF